jgi:hypothetical protein
MALVKDYKGIEMRSCQCDLCRENMLDGISFTIAGIGDYDFCETCIPVVRKAICRECKGKGTVSEIDQAATNAQASCGESRTQYKMVKCQHCL